MKKKKTNQDGILFWTWFPFPNALVTILLNNAHGSQKPMMFSFLSHCASDSLPLMNINCNPVQSWVIFRSTTNKNSIFSFRWLWPDLHFRVWYFISQKGTISGLITWRMHIFFFCATDQLIRKTWNSGNKGMANCCASLALAPFFLILKSANLLRD